MDTGGWWVFTPWGCKESLTTEQLFFLILGAELSHPPVLTSYKHPILTTLLLPLTLSLTEFFL